MNIKSGCVTLRAVERKDLKLLRELINDPYIEYMAGGESFPVSEDSQLRWFENYNSQKELRCMIEINNGATIGTIGLSNINLRDKNAEIFYKIENNNENRIKGDIHDSVKGILTYAFDELNLECVFAKILEYNIFSQKVLRKSGLKQEGILRKRVYKKGQYHDVYEYSILKEEFREQENI